MNTYEKLQQAIPLIEKKLNYSFRDRSLLPLAFTHRSYNNEHKEIAYHNERLSSSATRSSASSSQNTSIAICPILRKGIYPT
jgi:hypothetical protein